VVVTAAKAPAKRKAPAKTRKLAATPEDLHKRGARVVSVFGPFSASTLVVMPSKLAEELFPDGLGVSCRTSVVEAAERDVAAIRERDEALGDSALAASAVALAYEIEHPYNSATSKSMCAREMRDTLDRLRSLAPEEIRGDRVDDIAAQRAKRRAEGVAGG
jgi:hypothetical protein